MNIIEHLSRTITPVLLNNVSDTNGNRANLLEKVYAIIVARLADDKVANNFSSTTVANDDVGFFDRFLPETAHRGDMVKQLSSHYSVPEQEATSLISRAAPMVYNELRNLSGTTPVHSFLRSHLSSLTNVIPAWAYAFIPAGVLTAMNINGTHTTTTTEPVKRVVETAKHEEHLVRVDAPKSNPLKALLPLIGLLILGALAWALLKGCNKKPEPVVTPVAVSSTSTTSTTTTKVVESAVPAVGMATNSSAMATSSTGMATDTPVIASTTTTSQVISTTEPSVTFENGHLNFYFATDKDVVAGNAKEKAKEILAAAKAGKVLGISGYTDSTGNAAHNADLAKRRAAAVEKFLIDNGVPATQLKKIKPTDSVGANGKDQEGRRVEVYVADDATPAVAAVKTTKTTKVAPVAGDAKTGDIKLTDANTATATDATAASAPKL